MAYKIIYPNQNNEKSQPQIPQQPQNQFNKPSDILKILDVINKPQQQGQPQQAEEPSLLQRSISQVTRPISRAVESVRSLPRFASDVLTYLPNKAIEKVTGYKDVLGLPAENERQIGNFPSIQKARQESTQLLEKYLGKGANTADYKAEKLIDAVAGTLPIAWLTGGTSAVLPAAASAARGNIAAQSAKALGFGELGQFVADLGGSFGYNLAREGATPGKIRQLGEKKSKDLYKEAQKIAPKVNVYPDAKSIVPDIQKEIDLLKSGSSGIEKSQIKDVLKELNDTKSLTKKPGATAQKWWDKKKHLNKLYEKTDDQDIKNLYSRIVGPINDKVLNGEAATREGFSKVFNPAEDLHKAVNAQSALRRIFEENTELKTLVSKNPLGKILLLGTSGLKFGPKGAAATVAGTYGGRYITRAYDFFKTEAGSELGKEIAEQALSNNIPALTQSFTRFNKAADDYIQKNPVQKKWKIVKKQD